MWSQRVVGVVLVYGMLVYFMLGCGAGASGSCPTPVVVPFDTTLGPGDKLKIGVSGEEELTGDYVVTRHGMIHFPYVGDVKVNGLEPAEASDALVKALQDGKFFKPPHPQLSLVVQEYSGKTVVVTGSVNKPGVVALRPDLGAAEAIALAGGGSALANENSTVVSREVAGKLCRYQVPALDIRRGQARDFVLQPGDKVDVPQRPF